MLQLKVTESLYLKELEESHAEELFAAIDQSRDHLRKWLPWVDRTRTVADTLSFLKNMEDQKHEHKGLAMGIFRKEQLVGSVDMHDWNHELNKAALGYWLVENCQQKGIMQVCVRKFMNYLFDQLSLNKIE